VKWFERFGYLTANIATGDLWFVLKPIGENIADPFGGIFGEPIYALYAEAGGVYAIVEFFSVKEFGSTATML
jgi:hypothetical protein